MKFIITAPRYVVMCTLRNAGTWMDAAALTQTCGYDDPTAAYGVVDGLRQLGLVEAMKRRIDNRLSRVKLVTHWRLSEAGSRFLDEYEAGKGLSASKLVAEPEPETEPDYVPATIRELEDEVLRLRALVEKYVPVVVDVPGVGEVRLTREEAHTLLQQLLTASERE
jgi:hypothetical protein